MKNLAHKLFALLFVFQAYSLQADFLERLGLKKAGTNQLGSAVDPSSLSQVQVVAGLREALTIGMQQAIATLGRTNGFLSNSIVRIPMPQQLQSLDKSLRALKQDKLADDFVLTMNRAAEEAVPAAATIFGEAIKKLTIEDGKTILTGSDDAATQYFRRTMATNLYAQFLPIVKTATESNQVTRAYKGLLSYSQKPASKPAGNAFKDLLNKGNQYLGANAVDVDQYVALKAMDGLFKLVAEEEKRIRQNPTARTSAVLQQIFGAVKK